MMLTWFNDVKNAARQWLGWELSEAQKSALTARYGEQAHCQLLGPTVTQPKEQADAYYLPMDIIVDYLRTLDNPGQQHWVIEPGIAQYTDETGQINITARLSKSFIHKCQQADMILWPMCFHPNQQSRNEGDAISQQGHWLLMVFTCNKTDEMPHYACQIMDGCNFYVEGIPDFLKVIAKQLVNTLAEESSLTFSAKSIPPQQNSYDCGPAICYAAKQILSKKTLSEGIHYTNFRKDIAQALLNEPDKQPLAKKRRLR